MQLYLKIILILKLINKIPKSVYRRQDCVPIVYVTGSHYEVGYMIGQTFGKVIRDFMDAYEPLKEYLEIYETSEDGRRVYNGCLEVTNKYFPQYLTELKGMATGADVPFHKLFLIHLDDILISNIRHASADTSTGCSTLMVNIPCKGQFIGHNEDALSATINRFYIVSAHIKPKGEEGGGVFPVREEKWEAMTYAGSLPGYASGYNFHGLVFTINTIFAKKLNNKKIPSKQYGSVPNIALMSSADDALEIQSSLSIPTQLVSADSTKPDAAKGDFTRLPKKPWSSIPNIHITFDETEATEIECIPMNVLVEIENGTKPAYDVHVYSDLITNTSH